MFGYLKFTLDNLKFNFNLDTLKLFQKQFNSLIKKVFLMHKKGKALKRGEGWA